MAVHIIDLLGDGGEDNTAGVAIGISHRTEGRPPRTDELVEEVGLRIDNHMPEVGGNQRPGSLPGISPYCPPSVEKPKTPTIH